MIIQCEQCRTKFRLDDSKIRENGVKVRCAKCRHVFTVKKQQPEEREESSFDTVLQQSPGFSGAAPSESFGARQEAIAPEFQPEQPEESPFATAPEQPVTAPDVDFKIFEPSQEGEQPQQPPEIEFSFSPEEARQEAQPAAEEPPPSLSREFDFGEVDFGPAAEQQPVAESVPPEQPSPPARDEFVFPAMDLEQEPSAPLQEAPTTPHGEIDFGDLDFGPATEQQPAADVTREQFPAAESVPPEQALPPLEFEFELPDSSAAPQGQPDDTERGAARPTGLEKPTLVDEFDFAMELPTPPSAQLEPRIEEPFAFGAPAEAVETPPQPEIAPPSPGLPVQPAPVQPAEAKPYGPTIFEPPEPGSADSGPVPPESAEEALPPLSIPSRRKSSSMFKVLVALLVVVIAGAAAFYGKDLYPMLKQKIAPQSGKILLRSVTSSFVKNSTTGSELLVISGEAVNGFSTPRASLQVRGMVFGDKDQVLISKNAYCGNSLSAEQLATMPLDAIELAMANQVGSGLSNLEVAPGKALPFTVVIATVPEGAKNIGVVPAGSQALGDKPQ